MDIGSFDAMGYMSLEAHTVSKYALLMHVWPSIPKFLCHQSFGVIKHATTVRIGSVLLAERAS